MKKFLTLLVLATLCGGVNVEAATKRIYIVDQTWTTSNLYLYVYGGSKDLGNWPGKKAERVNDTNVFYYDMDTEIPSAETKLIINNNSGGDANQTWDFSLTSLDKVLFYVWHDNGSTKKGVSQESLVYKLLTMSGGENTLTVMTEDNGVFTGIVDNQTSFDAEKEVLIAPQFAVATDWQWDAMYRPWGTENTLTFAPVVNNEHIDLSTFDNSWKLTRPGIYEFTLDLTNITAPKYSIAPYITKSVAGNSKKLGTFSAEGAVAIPTGVTAYIGKLNTAKTGVDMVEVTDGVIPANTGVLYTSTADAGTQVKFYATNTGASFSTDGNILSGTGAAGKTLDEGDYVLATINNGQDLGFYPINAAANYGAFKAYIPSGSVSAAKLAINFGDETGIANLSHEKTDNVYYDLQGRRVMNPTKGLFIVNGKKVIR